MPEEGINLPDGAWETMGEVQELLHSLDLTKDELEDCLIGVVAAVETIRPGYIQLFLTTTLENRWRRQEEEENE